MKDIRWPPLVVEFRRARQHFSNSGCFTEYKSPFFQSSVEPTGERKQSKSSCFKMEARSGRSLSRTTQNIPGQFYTDLEENSISIDFRVVKTKLKMNAHHLGETNVDISICLTCKKKLNFVMKEEGKRITSSRSIPESLEINLSKYCSISSRRGLGMTFSCWTAGSSLRKSIEKIDWVTRVWSTMIFLWYDHRKSCQVLDWLRDFYITIKIWNDKW